MLTNEEKELLRKAIASGTFGSGPIDVTLATITTMPDEDIRIKLNEYKVSKIEQLKSQIDKASTYVANFQNELQSLQGE